MTTRRPATVERVVAVPAAICGGHALGARARIGVDAEVERRVVAQPQLDLWGQAGGVDHGPDVVFDETYVVAGVAGGGAAGGFPSRSGGIPGAGLPRPGPRLGRGGGSAGRGGARAPALSWAAEQDEQDEREVEQDQGVGQAVEHGGWGLAGRWVSVTVSFLSLG